MKEIVFVILHYMAVKETHMCVDFIRRNIDTEKYHIIIVDNASPNKSGELLRQTYDDNEDITVICNSKNLGFAKGNNIGYRYAKGNFSPQFIVLMNNDVFLIEKNLSSKLNVEYDESGFFVLGPMIMTKDGRCDINPDNAIFSDVDSVRKELIKYKKLYKRYKYYYAPVYYWLTTLYDALLAKKPKKQKNKNYLQRKENVKLHGCFMVFSKEYITKFDGLDENTFLYWEEEFLYKHMKEQGHKMVYCPEIVVYHQEDAATDSVTGGNRQKKLFLYENYIKSLEALEKLYQQYEL